MTRLWPAGEPITARIGADGQLQAFWWREGWHPVDVIANRWRVQAGWWTPAAEAARDYVKLTTTDGLLCILYQDLRSGEWYCARLYD